MAVLAVERPTAAQLARRSVAWSLVVPLAVLLAFADGFWMISLRGAIGAVARTQEPFAAYWRESLVAVPVFAVAVLGALIVAARPRHRLPRVRPELRAAAAVAIASGLVGTAALAVNSVYDYVLQAAQLNGMSGLHGPCDGTCIAQHLRSTQWAHVRGVAMVAGFLIITNLVVVLWTMALVPVRLAPVVAGQAEGAVPMRSRSELLVAMVAGVTAGAAAIHVAVVPEHLEEWPAAGAFFIVLAGVEVIVAALLLRRRTRPSPTLLVAAAAVSMAPLMVWLWSRLVGLPFGPEPGELERFGLPDAVASALEVAALVLAFGLLARRKRSEPTAFTAPAVRALALLAVLAVTSYGLAGTAPAWVGGFGGITGGHDHPAESQADQPPR